MQEDFWIQQKVKVALYLTMHHAIKTYWGSEGIAPRLLNLVTRLGWGVSFTTRPLYPPEEKSAPIG
jgi:hypothetical protein